jgi:hypothetical protein
MPFTASESQAELSTAQKFCGTGIGFWFGQEGVYYRGFGRPEGCTICAAATTDGK